MSEENLYHSDLRVDVHLDAYLSLTRLAERRWRIGVMLQPRKADVQSWWVNDAQVTLTCASGPLVSAVTVATEAGTAVEPQLWMPSGEERVWGFQDQIDTTVHANSQAMTHARFEFTVDPDVRGAVPLGALHIKQQFDDRLLHDADMFLTLVRFGTNSAGEVVFATPHQEIWWTDELLEPGESADVYYTVVVGEVPSEGRPCTHDWCNEERAVVEAGESG